MGFQNTAKKTSLTKQCLDWLHQQGCFAQQVYADGMVFILAMRKGKVLCICTTNQTGPHDPGQVMAKLSKAGAYSVCIKDLKQLQDNFKTGIFK